MCLRYGERSQPKSSGPVRVLSIQFKVLFFFFFLTRSLELFFLPGNVCIYQTASIGEKKKKKRILNQTPSLTYLAAHQLLAYTRASELKCSRRQFQHRKLICGRARVGVRGRVEWGGEGWIPGYPCNMCIHL